MPPLAEMVALPLASPKQPTLVWESRLVPSATAGCVMVTFTTVLQPLASVMVQVKLPAARLLAMAVVCTGLVFQL